MMTDYTDMEPAPQAYIDALNSGSIVQANHALKSLFSNQYFPIEVLQESVRSMSTSIPEIEGVNGCIFASGRINQDTGVRYKKYTRQLAENGYGLVTIGDTQAAQYLGSDDEMSPFRRQLMRTLEITGSHLDIDDVEHGFMANGVREPGIWDDISRGYAENARGAVVTVTPNAKANRVFLQVELPALLDNEQVESINGVPRVVVADYFDAICHGGTDPEAAKLMVNEDVVKLSSIKFMRSLELPEFSRDLGLVMAQDFQL
ncbi:MAG: hypothetical protein ACRBDL_07990, partial [Alphaproteobacteria bacterium]